METTTLKNEKNGAACGRMKRIVSWLFEERKVIKGQSIDSVIEQAMEFVGDEEGKIWAVKKPLFVSGYGFKIVLRKKTEEEIDKSRRRMNQRAELEKLIAS